MTKLVVGGSDIEFAAAAGVVLNIGENEVLSVAVDSGSISPGALTISNSSVNDSDLDGNMLSSTIVSS